MARLRGRQSGASGAGRPYRKRSRSTDALPPALRATTLPVENAFSTQIDIAKTAARTVPELWDAIRDALLRFTAEECANYFIAAGYEAE